MKFILSVLFSTALAVNSFGQTTQISADSVSRKVDKGAVIISNRFFDNWFIGAGAGAQMYFGDHDKQMKLSERLTPVYSGYVGKWFTPGIGTRVGINGFKMVGVTQNGAHSTGERYEGKPWEGYWLENQEFNYFQVHGDVLFNLSNIIGGYRADRFYEVSPYVGLGWAVTNDSPKAKEITGNFGILNTFRLSSAWNLTFDARGMVVNDRFDGEVGNRKNDGILSAQVGVVYKFAKRDWDRPTHTVEKDVVVKYDDALINSLRDKINRMVADNDALRAQLANVENKTITEIKVENRLLAAPILLTFPLNKSTLSKEARINLGFFAKVIAQGNEDVVYKITGYADKGTGNAAINRRLSLERAQAVFDVLTKEYHVSASRLKVVGEGGVDNMFYNDPRLSRAVVTIAE